MYRRLGSSLGLLCQHPTNGGINWATSLQHGKSISPDPLEKGMETHPSIQPGESHGHRSIGQRVAKSWTQLKWQQERKNGRLGSPRGLCWHRAGGTVIVSCRVWLKQSSYCLKVFCLARLYLSGPLTIESRLCWVLYFVGFYLSTFQSLLVFILYTASRSFSCT